MFVKKFTLAKVLNSPKWQSNGVMGEQQYKFSLLNSFLSLFIRTSFFSLIFLSIVNQLFHEIRCCIVLFIWGPFLPPSLGTVNTIVSFYLHLNGFWEHSNIASELHYLYMLPYAYCVYWTLQYYITKEIYLLEVNLTNNLPLYVIVRILWLTRSWKNLY